MLVGYARVSTQEQNLDRQVDALIQEGVDKRNIYQEKISGTKRWREQLDKMLEELQVNDTVVITDLTRISRSTKDLLSILDIVKSKGAKIKSIKDTWLNTTVENPYSEFLVTVMAGLSQLERDLISQRTKEGIASARARGRFGGRPSKRNDKAVIIKMMIDSGYKVKDIVQQTGLSRSTVYRVIRDNNMKHEKI